MTVITKAIGEKKPVDKMERPLVTDTENQTNHDPKVDPEAQHPPRDMAGHFLILRRPHLSRHSMTLYCLILTSLVGMSIGLLGGVLIYRRYAREQMHRFRTGWYSIPYERLGSKMSFDNDELSVENDLFKNFARDTEQTELALNQKAISTIRNFLGKSTKDFFKESFEFDLENEHYEKINVPVFGDRRQGRYVHDFRINLTAIIDLSRQSCFVMPLNRDQVFLPKNMYDLLYKMFNDYYEVNTDIVRKTMKVVLPAIRDHSVVGKFISHECENMPIYALEKINTNSTGGIVKRSVGNAVYGHFAGNNIVEYDIINIEEVQ